MRRIQRSLPRQVPGWWVLTRLSPGKPHPKRTWMNRRPCGPIRHQAQAGKRPANSSGASEVHTTGHARERP